MRIADSVWLEKSYFFLDGEVKKPNFFIIGAPKCGTTSLAYWLSEHPQIFMSAQKELYFFDEDQNIGNIKSFEQYLHFFQYVKDEHIAIGEASVTYLTSHVAVKNILSFNSNAKFIVLLRNPLEMVRSIHHELLWDGWECIEDFELAWHSRNERELGRGNSGKYCTYIPFLQYENMCKLGEQVERLLKIVDTKSVLFIVMDDLIVNPLQEYQRTLEFLGVSYDGRSSFNAENTRKIAHSNVFRNLIISFFHLKHSVGIKSRSFGILNYINAINNRIYTPTPLRFELRLELIDAFKSDVELLSTILKRDLSHWLK